MTIRLDSTGFLPPSKAVKQVSRASSNSIEPLDDALRVRQKKAVTDTVEAKNDVFERKLKDVNFSDQVFTAELNQESSNLNDALMAESFIKSRHSNAFQSQDNYQNSLNISYSAKQAISSFESNQADIAQAAGIELIGVDTYV